MDKMGSDLLFAQVLANFMPIILALISGTVWVMIARCTSNAHGDG